MSLDRPQLESPFRKLRKKLKKFPSRPTPQEVHKLRTRARRVETTIEALSPDGSCNRQRLLKVLSRVRKRAGKVRDMDVLTSYLTGIEIPGSENDCAMMLTEHLGAERSGKAGKLRKAVKQHGAELRRLLRQCRAEIAAVASTANGKTSGRKPNPATDAITKALETSAQLASQQRLGPANLHEYRLTIKRLLNVLEMAKEQDQDRRLIRDLKRVKDAIGEWHDWQVLEQMAAQVLDHGGCKLQSRLRATMRRKYEQALAVANQVKARYFGMGKVKTITPASPVLKATYGIAA